MAIATPKSTNPKILITGANGLLGQKLVKQLADEGKFEVIATGKGPCRLIGDGFTYQSLDITNEAEVNEVISKIAPETIIHSAAMTNVDECELNQEACKKVNVNATEYLVQAAEKVQSHFIFVSTDFIFSGENGPYDEEAEAAPVNFYGETKLIGENLVKNSKTSWAIARTVLVYGIANDLSRSNIILWVKNSLEAGKEIQVVDDQVRTPTLAEDLAAGCILMAAQKAEGIFNISGSDVLTPYQMAMMTADFFELNKDLIKKTDSIRFTQPAKRPLKTGFSIEKARKQLGFEPKTFKEGIGILSKQIILARS
ncbi:SDR family oxidoreductase [Algoriphagus boritolerans]|uniref:dTDP-4-dehydrorhamnose reductase n=1 Tax=Algoriphagus boritolerans DSM 17298 = JCM 18970 TaxID=1120964 RepID=A0A1H5UT71_9BACT|nr:SDR family oxidoreductase [Algoriphagus boritolerans]SEF78322.1 dTDP-4-dehydrorhamnose reductase [Algoriphagus boritolerans DSM 17298 = JCM 18970]